MQLTTDKKARKEQPIARGVLDYFPNAIAEVANVSFAGNQQHNPGEEMHWARGKSMDHADCIARHLIERGTMDEDGLRHSAKAAWRALAMLQLEIEADAKPDPLQAFKEDWQLFTDLGCPEEVAKVIAGGMSYPAGAPQGFVYIAGPMRGYDKFNFPAFDAARDEMLNRGYAVISPADIDRAGENCGDDPNQIDESDQSRFVLRDFYAIYFLKKQGNPNNAIVLLDRWENSTGATAENSLGKWLGVPRREMKSDFVPASSGGVRTETSSDCGF